MAKFVRRSLVVSLILAAGLFLLPKEQTPPTGKWLARAGLTSATVRVGRLDIRYVRKGTGPTLILIHGLASSIYSWADVVGPLSEKFDVIALDLPGFGASSQPADLTFADAPNAVLGLMDALGVARAHLVGNSMGGAVSLLLAARFPDRVDRVVILDSAGYRMQPAERPFLIRFIGSRAAGVLAEALPVKRLLTDRSLRMLMQDDTRVTEERIDEYVAPFLRPGALASARSLLASPVDARFVPDLAAIKAKTLVVWGRFDPWLPEADADRFVAAIEGARKVVLDTGHMPQEEKPTEVARLIGEFLSS